MEAEPELATRAEVFRFPAQVASLEAPLDAFVDTVFGESRYEESAAASTSPRPPGRHADRPAGRLAGLGLRPAGRAAVRRRRRSRGGASSCAGCLTDVIFGEAGLATLDPKAEHRRLWLWRGGAVAAAAILVLGALAFTVSYLSNRGAVAARPTRLRATLHQPPARRRSLNLALGGPARAAAAVPRASSDPPPRRRSRRRRKRPIPAPCATSSRRAWWRCSRRRCGGGSATPSSVLGASRPTGC